LTEPKLILAIDVGNSRIKWAIHDGRAFVREGSRLAADLDSLPDDWIALPAPDAVIVASVANHQLAERLKRYCGHWRIEPVMIQSLPQQAGVTNHYTDFSQLGADRWAALIGAHHLLHAACIVVCAGTATTVDALSASGDFLGGLILPGFDLMRESLAAKAARLSDERGSFQPFPHSTRDAIASGAVQAACGAIERTRSAMIDAGHAEPAILVSGGSAEPIVQHLGRPVQFHDKLILEGLVRIAKEPA
jgi:type III pantothenate kinase